MDRTTTCQVRKPSHVVVRSIGAHAVRSAREENRVLFRGIFWYIDRREELNAVPHGDLVLIFREVLPDEERILCKGSRAEDQNERDERKKAFHKDLRRDSWLIDNG